MIGKTILPMGAGGGSSDTGLKFYPNPAIYDYKVVNNSDASVGSGNEGSLRYCMTNVSTSGIIIFADTLTDTAGTGDIHTIKILSTMPSKVCTLYFNNNQLSFPDNCNFNIFGNVKHIFYSMKMGGISGMTAEFIGYFSGSEMYGCRIQNMYKVNGVMFHGFKEIQYCEFINITPNNVVNEYSWSLVFKNCYIKNCQLANFYSLTYKNCYLENINKLSDWNAVTIDSCYVYNCNISNNLNGTSYITNNIIVYNGTNYVLNCISANSNNGIINISNNTIISLYPTPHVFRHMGTNSFLNIKNNLILAPKSTVIISTDTVSTITDSNNVYMALNSDVKLPNSTRHTDSANDVLNHNFEIKLVDGIPIVHANPKGISLKTAPRLASVLKDYLGNNRTDPTDIGAIEI